MTKYNMASTHIYITVLLLQIEPIFSEIINAINPLLTMRDTLKHYVGMMTSGL